MRDLADGLVETVRREPWRAFLTLFGIALGTAAIVFLVAVLHGANFALNGLANQATGEDLNRVRTEELPTSPAGVVLPLSPADARALATHAQGAAPTTMVYRYGKSRITARVGTKTKIIGLEGGGSEFAQELGLELLHGRWLDAAEDGQRVCLIGFDVWEDLFLGKWPLENPSLVFEDTVSLTVVGVFAHRPSDSDGDGPQTWRLDRKVWVSNATFRQAIDPQDSLDEILLRHEAQKSGAARGPDVLGIARKLDRLLENRHLGVRNFVFVLLDKRRSGLDKIIGLAIGGVLSLAAFFSLLVGGINLMNAELMKLSERTREYGIRRALGATTRELGRGLVLEAMVFCVLGGVGGIILGILSAWGLSLLLTAVLAPWPFAVPLWSVGTALGASAIVGLLAGLAPARRARGLVVVECLRQVG